jgi:hypothetical protein
LLPTALVSVFFELLPITDPYSFWAFEHGHCDKNVGRSAVPVVRLRRTGVACGAVER